MFDYSKYWDEMGTFCIPEEDINLMREFLRCRSTINIDTQPHLKKLDIPDIVAVVRCKNCKYSKPLDRTKSPFKYYKDGCILCECEDVVGDEPMVYLPTHYCSYGEKR